MTSRLAHRLLPAILVVVLAGATLPALAQTPLDDPLDDRSAKRIDRLEKAVKELRAIIFQGRESGAPVVIQPADTQGQIGGLGDKISDLAQSLARLNGQLEVVRHDLDQQRQEAAELRAANTDLRERLAAAEKSMKDMTAPPAPPPALAAAAPADPAAAFAAARAAYDAGDNATAEAGFRDYIARYGQGAGGPEAQAYLARTLLARKAWSDAAAADIEAIRGWPKTRWAPDALLDLVHALIGMGKSNDACQALAELPKRYPKVPPTTQKTAISLRARAQCG